MSADYIMSQHSAIFKPSKAAMKWSISGEIIDLTDQGIIMGVVNTTPDSFSDGGKFYSEEKAVNQAVRLEENGARIIDFGGESTRPGADKVKIEDELNRVIPAIQSFCSTKSDETLISIDTTKPEIAEEAIKNGAEIINDVTGFTNPKMLEVATNSDCGLIVMHMAGNPQNMQEKPSYSNVVEDIMKFFTEQLKRCEENGIKKERIIFDPGIGFGKTTEHNLDLLKSVRYLLSLERPIMIGASRKSFISKILKTNDIKEREWPTVALTSYCRELGASIFRVHNSLDNFNAMRMTEAIINSN